MDPDRQQLLGPLHASNTASCVRAASSRSTKLRIAALRLKLAVKQLSTRVARVPLDQDDFCVGKQPVDQWHPRHMQRVLVDQCAPRWRMAERRCPWRSSGRPAAWPRPAVIRPICQLPGAIACSTARRTSCSSITCNSGRFISSVSEQRRPRTQEADQEHRGGRLGGDRDRVPARDPFIDRRRRRWQRPSGDRSAPAVPARRRPGAVHRRDAANARGASLSRSWRPAIRCPRGAPELIVSGDRFSDG